MSGSKSSYRVLAMVALSHAMGHLQDGVMPILYPSIMEEFQVGYIHVGFMRTASTFMTGFLQLFVSFLRRKILGRILLGLGNILLSAMNMISSLAGSFNQFILYRVIGGVGGSPQHPIGASMITKNFRAKQLGKAMGINLVGSQLSGVFAPLIATAILISLGWRSTVFICAIPSLCVGLGFIFLVKEARDIHDISKPSLLSRDFLRALRDRNVLAVSGVQMVMSFRRGVRAFIPSYFVKELTMQTTEASVIFSMMLVGGVIGSFVWGYISDRGKKKSILIFILFCSSVLFYSLSFIKVSFILALVLFFIGFMSQAVVVQTILADVANPTYLDEIFGFYYTLGFVLGSFSSVLLGFIVETFSFASAFIYISLVLGTSIIPAFFISEKKKF